MPSASFFGESGPRSTSVWSIGLLRPPYRGDGFFKRSGDDIACICDDVGVAGHVGFLAEPTADWFPWLYDCELQETWQRTITEPSRVRRQAEQ